MQPEDQFTRRNNRKKNLLVFAGLLAVVLIVNGVIGLFALNDSNESHLADLQTLGQINAALETARSAQVHFKKQVQEWKNILLRGSDPQEFARYQAAFAAEEKAVNADLGTLANDVQQLKLSLPDVAQVRKIHGELGGEYRNALQAYRSDDFATAQVVDKKVRGIDRAPTDQMDAIVDKIQVVANDFPKQVSAQTQAHYQTLRRVSIGGTTAGVVIVVIMLGISFVALGKE